MFNSREFLPDALIARVVDKRVTDPEYSSRVAANRVRRTSLTLDGKLNILAADHPARRVTKVGDDGIAMADRRDYLARIIRVMQAGDVDGLMATMDIVEDLLTIHGLVRESGGEGLVDGKLLIASFNRGGLAGTAWELDDPVTGPSAETCVEWRLDGAKILLRIGDDDAGSLETVLASAEAITECNAEKIPMFLEPLPVVKTDKGWTVVKTAEALAKIAGVASALGDSSRYLWLKLPYCERYEVVARSTTLPILLLGGESAGSPAPFLTQLASALQAGPNVRGALVGRNVLYPGDEDPLAMASAAGGIIHHGWTVEQALESFGANRGKDLGRLR
ncbi:MAG: hypothetical protein JSU00_04760 [Acidobacteria bacterium]|nr:hypothetical protein [Acidobacteriota bacterium]